MIHKHPPYYRRFIVLICPRCGSDNLTLTERGDIMTAVNSPPLDEHGNGAPLRIDPDSVSAIDCERCGWHQGLDDSDPCEYLRKACPRRPRIQVNEICPDCSSANLTTIMTGALQTPTNASPALAYPQVEDWDSDGIFYMHRCNDCGWEYDGDIYPIDRPIIPKACPYPPVIEPPY